MRAYFGVLPDANFDGPAILAFIRQLRRNLGGPIVVVRDRLKAHIGEPIAAWLIRHRCTVQA